MIETIEQLISAPEGRYESIRRDYNVNDVKNFKDLSE